MNIPPIIPETGFYMHYKHDSSLMPHDHMYEVVGLARNTEEKTFSVLYRPLYENDWFPPAKYQSRPLDMFLETVEKDGQTTPRFKHITDAALVAELAEVRKQMYPEG